MFGNRTVMPSTKPPSDMNIEDELRTWWKGLEADAEALVGAASGGKLAGGDDLWNGIPVIDSKVVTETSGIFERILGIPLDIRLIHPGGYLDIEALISDLVPKMKKAARDKVQGKPEKKR